MSSSPTFIATPATPVTALPEWETLQKAADTPWSLRELAADEDRSAALALDVDGIYLDASRQLLDVPTWQQLLALAESAGVAEGIAAMAAGEKINTSEDRSVLHLGPAKQ